MAPYTDYGYSVRSTLLSLIIFTLSAPTLIRCQDPLPAASTELLNDVRAAASAREYGSVGSAGASSTGGNFYASNGLPGYAAYDTSGSGNTFNTDPYSSSSAYYYGPPGTYDSTKKKKPPPSYSSYGNFYPAGPPAPVDCQEHMMTSIISDVFEIGGITKFGLLKSIVAAITAAFLAKIPIILALKALVVKIVLLPLGLLVISAPILVPIFLLFMPLWTRIKDAIFGPSPTAATGTASAQPTMVVMVAQPQQPAGNATQPGGQTRGRSESTNYMQIAMKILESEQCFEKLACQLGAEDSSTFYEKPVLWLMKFLQTFKVVQNNYEVKSKLKRYKEAYKYGSDRRKKKPNDWIKKGGNSTSSEEPMDQEDDICTDQVYPCNLEKSTPEDNFFRETNFLDINEITTTLFEKHKLTLVGRSVQASRAE